MWSRASLVLAVALGVAASGAVAADSDITVDPVVGTPDTAFHVEVPNSFPVRQVKDRYWFVLHGPGGRTCDGSPVTDRVGITPPRRARTVAVDLPGVRVVSKRAIVTGPWCVGTFNGHVEFRDWRRRSGRYVTKRI